MLWVAMDAIEAMTVLRNRRILSVFAAVSYPRQYCNLCFALCQTPASWKVIFGSRGGDSYQKVGGGGAKLCHISPGLPLLFLEYIMQKGKKNEESNLNAWDRSFEKLDMPHT